MIAAIILAAGKSERMGYPKALLRFQGKTFLERILDSIRQSRLGHTVVVVGHHREAIGAAMAIPNVVFNARYEEGMSTSVQAGITALPGGQSGVALFLVDHPLIEAETIDELISHVAPGRIVVPVHGVRRGHPVIFAADLFAEILQLATNEGLNVVVRRDPARVVEVPVKSPGVLRDIDTPHEFDKLLHERP